MTTIITARLDAIPVFHDHNNCVHGPMYIYAWLNACHTLDLLCPFNR